MQPEKRSSRWLPLRDGHAVPIEGLLPEEIKAAAKAVHQGPGPEIRHTTLLNAIVKALGFSGGFPGFLREGAPHLERVLREQGLKAPRNLFDSEFNRYALSREALAGRLFHSRRPMPHRVWLGGDGFDWDPIVPVAQSYLPNRERWWEVKSRPLKENLKLLEKDASILPMVLANEFSEVNAGTNLLGDVLLQPRDGTGAVIQTYWQNDSSSEEREQKTRDALSVMTLFRTWIEQSPLGWVDVLPVTDKLVLLRGREGGWDFVFADLRAHPPPVQPFAHMLAPDDVPAGLWQDEVITAREYNRSGAWRDMESHRSEEFYYASGGKASEYPGGTEILHRYLLSTGGMRPLPRRHVKGCPKGWVSVIADGKRLFVSPLVTISEFECFLAANGYRERRMVRSPLEDANGQDPKHLPVAVTWFDALAYAAWIESTQSLPVRMPRVDEYLVIHPGALPTTYNRRVEDGCIDSVWSDGRPLTRWKVGDDYGRNELTSRFRDTLLWRQGQGGLAFLCSDSFGEWLMEHAGDSAAAINTNDLEAIVERNTSPKRGFFLADDWGAYQACKIGFRLCVESD